MKVAVIGSGAWGTALALVLAENQHDVLIWAHDESIARDINETHENAALFSGVTLPDNIRATTSIEEACRDAELCLIVVASQFYKKTLAQIHPLLPEKTVIVSATKGLDRETNQSPIEMADEILGAEARDRFAVLSGPNIAREVAARKPAATVIASRNNEAAEVAQRFFSTGFFRVYTNDDIVGVELGGTLKNIIAIAAGILDGLELGSNARSALMTRGLVEIIRFGLAHGANPETFYGLAGLGDLITTCSSPMSRNHTVGSYLAQGLSLEEVLNKMTAVAEGVETTRRIYKIARSKGIEMPVTAQVHGVLFEGLSVREALENLMTRELKSESS